MANGKKGKSKARRAASAVGSAAASAGRTTYVYVQSKAKNQFSIPGLKKLLRRGLMVGLGGAMGGVVTVVGDVKNVTPGQYLAAGTVAEVLSGVVGAEAMGDSFAGAMVAHATVNGAANAIKGLLTGS